MTKTLLTIGLNDKDTEQQKIESPEAKNIIANILLNQFNIFAIKYYKREIKQTKQQIKQLKECFYK